MKTVEEMREIMNLVFAECQDTREQGQKEYAGGTNAFGNFERLSSELGITRERVLWIYLKKHYDGVLAYINGHKSQREDVRGRIKDMIVYLVLLRGMIEDSENTKEPTFGWAGEHNVPTPITESEFEREHNLRTKQMLAELEKYDIRDASQLTRFITTLKDEATGKSLNPLFRPRSK